MFTVLLKNRFISEMRPRLHLYLQVAGEIPDVEWWDAYIVNIDS